MDPKERVQSPRITLNALEVSLSTQTFTAWREPMPEATEFKSLRSELEPSWFVRWSNGWLEAMPWGDVPPKTIGSKTEFAFSKNPQFAAALFIAQLRRWLIKKFPKGRIFGHRPVTMVPTKGELINSVLATLKANRINPSVRSAISGFRIWRQIDFDARLVEARLGETRLALVISPSMRWEIRTPLEVLARHGVNLDGLVVVRKDHKPGERRLIGRIDRLEGRRLLLSEAYTAQEDIPADQIWLEGSRTNFVHCLRELLDDAFDEFEAERKLQESELLRPSAFLEKIAEVANIIREASPIRLGPDLSATIGRAFTIKNSPDFKSIISFPAVEYYYNRALTKRHKLAWAGIEKHSPYAPPTERSPRIVAFCPDNLQANLEVFLRFLRDGVDGQSPAYYERGFASALDLLNPSFELEIVPWERDWARPSADRYRDFISRYITDHNSRLPHVAIVVIPDAESKRPAASNPYYHAKSLLLTAGVPVQAVREATLRQRPYDLQFTLQDFATSLFAKLQGIPWTIDPQLTINDEVVIGLGSCELTGSRFEKRQRFVGITTVFSGDGTYILSDLARECSFDEYPERLQNAIDSTLQELRRRNGWRHGDTIRIVVHSFKPFKQDEAEKIIRQCVDSLSDELRVQYAFLTVSNDHAFATMDTNQKGIPDRRGTKGALVPERGTCVRIGSSTHLLSVRGPNMMKGPKTPLPRPLLIHLHPSSNFRSQERLAEQVLRFTSLSWRSTRPAREPVTMVYSEHIARQLSRLNTIPGWNLDVVNRLLRNTCWFL